MSMLGRMFGFGRNERYDRGLRYFDQGLYEQAVDELSSVVADDSDADSLSRRLAKFYVAEAYSNLGVSALQKQSYEKAREFLSKALELNADRLPGAGTPSCGGVGRGALGPVRLCRARTADPSRRAGHQAEVRLLTNRSPVARRMPVLTRVRFDVHLYEAPKLAASSLNLEGRP